MISKRWILLLIAGMTALVYGCGNDNTDKEANVPIEQVSEEECTSVEKLSFELINDSITMECGTPFDEDITKYVKADNVENITMEIVNRNVGSEKDFELLGRRSEIDYIKFKDIKTQDEATMKVNYQDTIAPVIKFEGEDIIPFYTMLSVFDYEKNESKIVKRLEGNGVDGCLGSGNMDGSRNSIAIVDRDRITSPKNGGSTYKINFEISDEPITNTGIWNIVDYDFFLESDEDKTSIDYSELPQAGEYDYTLNVKDEGGNIGNVKFKVKVIEDVDPEEKIEIANNYISDILLLDSSERDTVIQKEKERFGEEIINELVSLIDYDVWLYERQISQEDREKIGSIIVEKMIEECKNTEHKSKEEQ